MASSKILWNEVARIANIEFFEHNQPLTGILLMQLVKAVAEMLTEQSPSA